MDLKVVGQRIKEAREAKNLTQEELAGRISALPMKEQKKVFKVLQVLIEE